MNNHIAFRPLGLTDIPLMYQWFNMPSVQAFYSLRTWTEEEVLEKLRPYILGQKPVSGLIILLNNESIGYLQHYKVIDYPWPNQTLSQDIIENVVGMDLFIGEPKLIGQGLGQAIISAFLEKYVWPKCGFCVVDPDIRNLAAIKCYKKLGFKNHQAIDTVDAMNHPVQLQLMVANRAISL
jgi:RimJ/RimL family protein N-acetyltransferase